VAVMAMPAAEKTRCLGFMVGPSKGIDPTGSG
jgi:hypothetical protein